MQGRQRPVLQIVLFSSSFSGGVMMQSYRGLCKAGVAVIDEIPFHVCKELTVIYLLENDLKMTTVAGSQVLSCGQTEILNVKEPVMLEAVAEFCRVIYFSFDKAYIESVGDNFDHITYNCNICNFFGAAAESYHIEKLNSLLFHLLEDMTCGVAAWSIREKLDAFLTYIREKFDDVGHVFSESTKLEISKERFQRISEYMIAHVSEKMSLNEIAQNEYLSIPYLSKEFSSKLEKSYHAIINYYRTINAVIQLLDTEDTLTNIAENSGFSSVRYYNKVFSDYLGCLPSKFRSIYRGKAWRCSEENLSKRILSELMAASFEENRNHYRLSVKDECTSFSLCCDAEGEAVVDFVIEGDSGRKLIVAVIEDATYWESKRIMMKMKPSLREHVPVIDPKKEYVLLSEDEQRFQLVMFSPWKAEIHVILLDQSESDL